MILLFKSIMYIFLSVMTSYIVHMYAPFTFDLMCKYSEFTSFKEIIILSLMISMTVVFTALFIAFVIKAIQNLASFIFIVFFNDNDYTKDYKKVTVEIDENDFIQKSYIEFMNGKRIPFHISKMIAPKVEEVKEENITEVKENNE